MNTLVKDIQAIRPNAQFRVAGDDPALVDVEWLADTVPVTEQELADFLAMPTVPQSVTPLQARRAMRQIGVLDAVKSLVAQDVELQEAFDFATSFQRRSAFIAKAQPLLGWTDAHLDDMFRLAASLPD